MGCRCNPRLSKSERKNYWVVVQRMCNYSAFNGRRRTSSAYSLIHCVSCSAVWRTKADYVQDLRDGAIR